MSERTERTLPTIEIGDFEYHRNGYGRWQLVASPNIEDLGRPVGVPLTAAIDEVVRLRAELQSLKSVHRGASGGAE